VNAAERRVGIAKPMKGVAGDDEVEFVVEREIGGVGHLEVKIGAGGVSGGEGDHIVGGVDADDGAVGNTGGDFGGDAAVAASDVENPFVAAKMKKCENFGGHSFLQAGAFGVGCGVPFGHDEREFSTEEKSKMEFAVEQDNAETLRTRSSQRRSGTVTEFQSERVQERRGERREKPQAWKA
jgi:hypothetical protein